jgi:hypothetical protein
MGVFRLRQPTISDNRSVIRQGKKTRGAAPVATLATMPRIAGKHRGVSTVNTSSISHADVDQRLLRLERIHTSVALVNCWTKIKKATGYSGGLF